MIPTIHQVYTSPEGQACCFPSAPYTPFCLYEGMVRASHADQQGEYAAMRLLYHALPDRDADNSWLGFTSANQLTKQPHVFASAAEVETQLAQAPILVWGWTQFCEEGSLYHLSLLEASETAHPGITGVLIDLLQRRDLQLPPWYRNSDAGPLANYWAMTTECFRRWMAWSLPLVDAALAELGTDSLLGRYLATSPRALVPVHRRLFICWVALQEMRLRRIGEVRLIAVRNPHRAVKREVAANKVILNLGEGCAV